MLSSLLSSVTVYSPADLVLSMTCLHVRQNVFYNRYALVANLFPHVVYTTVVYVYVSQPA